MGDKMLVLHIGPEGQGGVSTMIDSILASPLSENYNFYRIETITNKRKIFPYIKALFTCMKIKDDVSLVHIHMASNGSYLRKSILVKYFYKNNTPVVIHLHGAKFREYYNELSKNMKKRVRNTFSMASKIIVLTEDWMQFVNVIGVSNKTVVIPNFTSIPILNKVDRQEDKSIKLLFLGRLGKRKGSYDLIKAIACLYDDYKANNIECILAGDGEIEKSKSYIAEFKLDKIISVVGWVDNRKKAELLSDSDILVLPSYYESFGLSLIEGMSYGIPVIGTTAGSIPKVVRNGEDGILIEAGNIESLAEAINLLCENKELRMMMGSNGRKHAQQEYSIESFSEKIDTVYKEILN